MSGLLDGALRPLDVARREVFAYAWRFRWLAPALRRSETRVRLLASASVVMAFALSAVVPGALFVLGPALFGVPHLASDIRYLVLRQHLPRSWLLVTCSACAALVLLRVVELFAPHAVAFGRIEVTIGWGWTIAGVWMGAFATRTTGAWRRGALVAAPLLMAAFFAVRHPGMARALFAYGHNVVGLAIWFVLFRRRKVGAAAPLALVVLGTAILASGVTTSLLGPEGPWLPRFLHEARMGTGLAPRAALLVALTYVFLQAIHYSVWLAWIPRDNVRQDASLTFRMSARAALRDFGPLGLAAIALAAFAMVALSLLSLHRTRAVYLSVATFHGYLELACLAFVWVRGERATR